jgi:hypothetical protein
VSGGDCGAVCYRFSLRINVMFEVKNNITHLVWLAINYIWYARGSGYFPCVMYCFTGKWTLFQLCRLFGNLQSGASVWSQLKLCSCERFCAAQHRGSVYCRLSSLVQVAVLWLDCCCNTVRVSD